MKNYRRLLFTCFLLLFFLGFSFSPIHPNFDKNAEEVIIKITFQVDMQYKEVHPEGVFLSCNVLNGYAQTKMVKDVSSDIWSLTIDAPIGYEVLWKFLNGPDQWEPNDALEECSILGGFSGYIRTIITGNTDQVVPPFCYGYCSGCDLVSGNQETLFEKAISLSPNPASDKVFVKYLFDSPEILSLHLRDASGRLVRSEQLGKVTIGEYEINLEGLGAGFYWVEFSNGRQWFSEKLVIE